VKVLDINVLLEAVNTASTNHTRQLAFLERILNEDEVVALPWHTLLGFLRIGTDRRNKFHLEPRIAVELIERWLACPNVRILHPGERHWTVLRELVEVVPAAGQLIPDAHLAALAIENGAELCSADTDFSRFPRLKWTDPTRPA
jgi:toxin-antitoxin system PIN domain toxin